MVGQLTVTPKPLAVARRAAAETKENFIVDCLERSCDV